MLKAGSRIGRFEILAQIASSSMSDVYRARDPELGRDVVVKVLPPRFAADPERVERARREARAAAAAAHPNIVTLHEVGIHDGSPYFVGELVEGATLREEMRGGAMSPRRAVAIAVQIARGLAAAHGKGIVHRDLKPGNVVITGDGTVKLIDFGIARLLADGAREADSGDDTSPDNEAAIGTPGYMAPEQVRGLPAGPPADLFALGCILYEMLAGRPAFAGRTAAERMAAVLHEDPQSLAASARGVPTGLARVVERCLEKRPEDRFHSAHDVALALHSAGVSGERPATGGTPGRRLWWAAAAVIVVAGAVALWSSGAARAFWRRLNGDTSAAAITSLAVLPLENLSGDPLHDYLADGMTEELIARLGRVGTLRVIARSSVMRFKGSTAPPREIGTALGVDALVTGSVSASGDRVRVVLHLVRVGDERTLWSQRLETPMRDVVALQSALAMELVEQIRATVSASEREALTARQPVVPEAYQAYLRGRTLCGQASGNGFRLGGEELERAVSLDPQFAAAQAELANCRFLNGYWGFEAPADAFGPARRAAREALKLEPANPGAIATLGMISLVYDWDWEQARAQLEQAVSLDPSAAFPRFFYAWYLVVVRDSERAVAQAKRAAENDALSPWAASALAFMNIYAGRPEDALPELERAVALEPLSAAPWATLAFCRAHIGRTDEAAQALARTQELGAPGTQLVADLWRVNALVALDRRDEAEGVLSLWLERRKLGYVDLQYVAAMAASVGRNELALDLLEQAFVDRSPTLIRISADTWSFGGVRSDARFQALLRRMDYPPLGAGAERR